MIPTWGTSTGRNSAGGIPSLLLNFSNQSYFLNGTGYNAFGASPGITFSRGTNATMIDSTGQLTYAPSNQIPNSESFTALTPTGTWAPTGLAGTPVVSNATVAPNGTTTADSIVEFTGGAASTHRIDYSGLAGNAGKYAASVYLKAGTKTFARLQFDAVLNSVTSSCAVQIDLSDGTPSSTTVAGNITAATATSESVGNGWYRLGLIFTISPTYVLSGGSVRIYLMQSLSPAPSYVGDGSNIFVWGAQFGAMTYETAPCAYNSTTPKNLLGYTEEFNNAAWVKSNATVTANAIADPNGYLNADKLVEDTATSEHFTDQSFSIVTGNIYTFSAYLKAGERTQSLLRFTTGTSWSGGTVQVLFTLTGSGSSTTISGSPITQSITAVGNGWYRCSISALTIAATSPAARIQLSNGSTVYTGDGTSGVYIWGAQISDSASVDPYVYNPAAALTSTAYYGPRFDYDPVTLNPLGLLIEEARTNLLLYSEQLDVSATWAPLNGTVTANTIISPDGTTNADAFIESTLATSFHSVAQTITKAASNIQYTVTIYAKAKGRQMPMSFNASGSGVAGRVDLDTGTIASPLGTFGTGWTAGSLTITPAGNGWYRVVLVATSNTATTAQIQYSLYNTALATNVYTGDGVSGVYLWGAQLEAGGFATSYIPTVAASATRSADVATMVGNNFTNWYNQTTGTLAVTFDASANGSATYVSASNGTITQNSVHVDNEAGNIRATYYSGSTEVAPLVLGAIGTIGATNKIATAYTVNDFAASRNGGTVATDTVGAVPVGLTQLNIGVDDRLLAANYTSNHIKAISYFNSRLPNSSLQALTT